MGVPNRQIGGASNVENQLLWDILNELDKLAKVISTSTGGGTTLPYKVYTALLTQSGTDSPVATVLENTLGGTPIWTRDVQGEYTATLSGGFTIGKTFVISPAIQGQGYTTTITANQNTNTINIATADNNDVLQDGLMTFNPIEIRVYP